MASKKRTTIYDIANRLGITPSSVSRALNDKAVNEKTKKLILQTAKEMNYKKNSLASNLRKGESTTIGVVVPRINQNFFSNVIAGIETETYKKGHNLIICQSDESFEKEKKCISMLINQHVNCIITSLSVETNDYQHLQAVLDQDIELIQFDRVADEIESLKVINDNEQASYEAVVHMMKQGYKRIALLEGPQNLEIFRQRKVGYLRALTSHDIAVDNELIKVNAWTKELGAEATRELLSLSEAPDAIFASTSDFSALGVHEVAIEMGFTVPSQLGICGYANEPFTEITRPSITTIDQFSFKMGTAIAELYFEHLNSPETHAAPKVVSIKPELIIRASTSR
jgi:LacI family transcriptional regulator, repressor for deo operon, udp, cdd, tsx, nupC, and nupG